MSDLSHNRSWFRWWLPTIVAFALIAIAEHIGVLSFARPYVAPVYFLYAPFLWQRMLKSSDVGLTWPTKGWGLTLVSGAVIFVGFYLFTRYLLWGPWPGTPDSVWLRLTNEILFAALPEELFFRGWMQPAAERMMPSARWQLFGITLTGGIVLTAGAFALVHLAAQPVARLSVFFPGLWFGILRRESGSIVPAVAVHALSNVLMAAATGY